MELVPTTSGSFVYRFAIADTRGRSRVCLLAALFALVPLLAAGRADAASSAQADFNGDGLADLAVGAPQDSVSGRNRAGAVNVLYGSVTGLRAERNQQSPRTPPGC